MCWFGGPGEMREKKQVWERGCYPGATLWATLERGLRKKMTAAGGPRRRQDRAYSIPLVCRRQPRMLPSPWTSSSPAQERFCPRGGLPWSYPVAYPVPTLGYRVAETKWAAARSTGRGRRRAQHQQEARGEARRTVPAPSPCVARFSSYWGRCPGALQGKPTETARAENG